MTNDKSFDTQNPTDPAAADAAFTESASQNQKADRQDEMDKLRNEVREANDRALRSHAELENFRKRSRREMEDERRYAALPLMNDILNVVDDLKRAIDAAETSHNSSSLLEGVKMVAAKLNMYLEQHNGKKIEAVGAQFDPNVHDAISQEPSTEYPAGVVSRVAQDGFQLHDRVIRPAKVWVSTGAPTK